MGISDVEFIDIGPRPEQYSVVSFCSKSENIPEN